MTVTGTIIMIKTVFTQGLIRVAPLHSVVRIAAIFFWFATIFTWL
jgi:hypothetical protein